ncbi:ACT domain-containing protein [Hysterangium stoloniferum]|nr:ACT domain-containing protein [Hysterangium stoloniferum]
MPPQTSSPSLYLQALPKTFYLVQLDASEPLPAALIQKLAAPLQGHESQFISITRTGGEVSIVSDFSVRGGGGGGGALATKPETTWRCIRVAGPMDLSLTGIMNDLTTPLKAAEIPVFAISTWDTDFLLVPEDKGDTAVDVMRADGWTVIRV